MKILAIRVKNLASLEGITEIDFTQEPLCSAGIFAITGPTGAGKSTILDALCLALYARTPRYMQARETGIEIADVQGSTISQSDVRAILRDGTADGYAEVDFVGIDGQRYRANWSVRRARNRTDGSLQQSNTTLKNLTTGNDIGGRKTELLSEIIRLVGLNYEQFIRSVLLAQGDFTAFLKADKDQKASLLEKLTGTHIYSELSKKVFERYREEDQQLKLLQHRQEGIVTLTTEELTELKERETRLVETLEQLEASINETLVEIKWHEDLDSHETQVQEAERALQACLTEKEQSIDRGTYLKQVEQVQTTRTWMDALHEAAGQFTQRKEAFGRALAVQRLLARQVAETEASVVEATKHMEAQIAVQEQAKPLLDEARKLDAQLQAKEADLNIAQQQLDARRVKWEASRQRFIQQQQEAESLMRQISTRQEWKEKHRNRQSVAENRTLIVSRLTDARKQLDAIGNATEKAVQFEAEILATTAERAQLVHRSESLAKEVSEATTRLEILQKELLAIPVEQLQEESKAIGAKVENIRSGVAHWQQLCHALRTERILTEKSENTQRELADKEAQFNAATSSLKAITEQRMTSAAMLEKATLAASENVEALRAELVDGNPCPVCGSKIHPYAHENPQLNHVLNELKNAHEAHEVAYREQLTHHSQLMQSITLLHQAIDMLENDRQKEGAELRSLTTAWEAFAVAQACSNIALEERESWLAEQLVQAKAKQDAIVQYLEHYQTLQSQREATRQTWQNLQSQYTDTANAVKDLERAIQLLNERRAHAQSEQTVGTANLEDTLASLHPNFPDDLWIVNWKNQPDVFLESIHAFADEWKQVVEAQERDRNAHDVLQATLVGLQTEEQRLAADIAQAEQDLADKQAVYKTLAENRRSIFNGETVEILEVRFKQHVVQAQDELMTRKQRQTHLQTESTRTDAIVKEMETELARLETRISELSGKIEQWLAEYQVSQQLSLDRATLQTLLSHSSEWIAKEREVLSAIERAVTQTTSILEERRRQLAQHEKKRPSDQIMDALKQQLLQQQVSRSTFLKEHNEIGFRLKQDEANKRQLGNLFMTMQSQATVVENWSKLNEVIGSADGKKFRQVAQEYTLDVLLGYANVHLEILSKRYRLQRIPHTLGLQVLDQDMGDEVRTVYSLSGGESFLVSLALALGLASLSASRMKVESLFIDEGFGSLDPSTLNIAMDALERLHNQGRKVGVISHVQEMTERIPVQIQVSKQQSGRSRVEVI